MYASHTSKKLKWPMSRIDSTFYKASIKREPKHEPEQPSKRALPALLELSRSSVVCIMYQKCTQQFNEICIETLSTFNVGVIASDVMALIVLLRILRLCLTLEVVSQLGDITLLSNETLHVEMQSLFSGVFVEYQVKSAIHSAAILNNNKYQEITSAHFLEERQIGPTFEHMRSQYFVLFSSHLIEMWRLDADLRIEKMWDLSENRGSITGMDVQTSRASVHLLYWTLESQLFYVNCFPVGKPTSLQVRGIVVHPLMKVAICSNENTIVIGSGISTLDTVTSYEIDFITLNVSVTYQRLYRGSEVLLDVICTESAFVLTSLGVYSGLEVIFPNEGHIISLSKEQSNYCTMLTSFGVFYHDGFQFRHAFPYLKSSNFQLLFQIDWLSYGVFFHLNTYWIFQSQSQTFEWIEMSETSSMHSKFILMMQGNIDAPVLLVLNQTDFGVYSLSFDPISLQVKAANEIDHIELCATDRIDGEELCQNSTIRVIPNGNLYVLSRDKLNLTSTAPSVPALIVQVTNVDTYYTFRVSEWLSGSNLQYSLSIPSLPKCLDVATKLENESDIITTSDPIHTTNINTQCIALSILNFLAVMNSTHIEVYDLDKKSEHYIQRNSEYTPIYSTFYGMRYIILYGENGNRISIEAFGLEGNEYQLLKIQVRLYGIRLAENRVLGYSEFEVYEIELYELQLNPIFKAKQRIIDIWGSEEYLWVLSSAFLERMCWKSGSVMSFPIDSVARVIGHQKVLLLYHTSNVIQVYQVRSHSIAFIKAIELHPNCVFRSFDISSQALFVKCAEYIQVIAYLLPVHNSQRYIIKSTNTTFLGTFLHFQRENYVSIFEIEYLTSKPRLIHYLLDIKRRTEISLAIRITDTDAFAQKDFILMPVAISAVNDYNNTLTIFRDIQLQNCGAFLAVNQSWSRFELSVPWTDSVEIDLSELFIGAEASLMLNSIAVPNVDLKNKYSEVSSLDIGLISDQAFDIYPELNLTIYVKSGWVVFQQYLCETSQCHFTLTHRILLSDLNIDYFLFVKLIAHEQDSVLLYVEGISTINLKLASSIIIEYNVKSLRGSLLLQLTESSRSHVFHIFRDNDEIFHFFQCSFSYSHYTLKWNQTFVLQTKEIAKLDFLCFATSFASVNVENVWTLYALDLNSGILEFELKPEFRLRNIIQKPYSRVMTSVDNLLILGFEAHLEVYSMPGLQLLRRIELLDNLSRIEIHELNAITTNMVSIKKEREVMIVNIEAVERSQILVRCSHCQCWKISASKVAFKYLKDATLHFIEFQDPILKISPSASLAHSEAFQFTIIGMNPRGNVTSPSFTLYRSAQYSYLLIAGVAVLCAVAALMCLKVRATRKLRDEEIELETVQRQ